MKKKTKTSGAIKVFSDLVTQLLTIPDKLSNSDHDIEGKD